MHDAGWYAEHDVDLRTGTRGRRASTAARGRSRLADGDDIGYDKLLLATGVDAAPLAVPGADLRRRAVPAHPAPTRDRIAAALADGARLVVIGAGWIGLEVAAAARAARRHRHRRREPPACRCSGCSATEMARVFADLHREHGVDVPTSAPGSREIRGDGGRPGTSSSATAPSCPPTRSSSASASRRTPSWPSGRAGGRQRRPRRRSGCAPATRTSSPPATSPTSTIRCCGTPGPGRALGQRPELRAGRRPRDARTRTSATTGCRTSSPTSTTWAWSTPAGCRPATTPRWSSGATSSEREFIAFWIVDGRVLAGMNVNVWDVNDDIQALIRAGQPARRSISPGSPTPASRSPSCSGHTEKPLSSSALEVIAFVPYPRIAEGGMHDVRVVCGGHVVAPGEPGRATRRQSDERVGQVARRAVGSLTRRPRTGRRVECGTPRR